MTRDTRDPPAEGRMTGSLRDALAAAAQTSGPAAPPPLPLPMPAVAQSGEEKPARDAAPSAAEAAREARGKGKAEVVEIDLDAPQTRVVRAVPTKSGAGTPVRTQLLRGRQPIKTTDFFQDPVVGWLVVVGGAGLGAFRPIFEGNNTIGRAKSQRIPIDFGDETISSEEQAYIRYDSVDRKFLLVPNLAKTNIVAVNDRKPTGAVELAAMDLITMGRTQLVFVPFCGGEFDWAELSEAKG